MNGTTDITLLDNVTESPIATSENYLSTMDDLSHSQFVVDNGDRLTIKSNSLFEDNGILISLRMIEKINWMFTQ